MKRKIQVWCVVFMLFAAYVASAQSNYEKGDILLNAGLGVGYYYAGGTSFIASGEYFVNDAISVGPYFGFTSYNYKYNFGNNNKFRYTFIDFGARGSYHFTKHLDLNTDKVDLYGGVFLGFLTSSYSYDGSTTGYNDPYGSQVRAGLFAGVRYYFTPRFGVNGELGYGISPLILGVSFKL